MQMVTNDHLQWPIMHTLYVTPPSWLRSVLNNNAYQPTASSNSQQFTEARLNTANLTINQLKKEAVNHESVVKCHRWCDGMYGSVLEIYDIKG